MNNRLIRLKELKSVTGLSESTILRMEKAGVFPMRRKVFAGCVAWLEKEVEEWMENLPKTKPIIPNRERSVCQ